MVVTRKQAAGSHQATPSQDVLGTDISPDSNLNLLASSASSEALNPGAGRRTAMPSKKENAQHGGSIVPDASSQADQDQSTPSADEPSVKKSEPSVGKSEPSVEKSELGVKKSEPSVKKSELGVKKSEPNVQKSVDTLFKVELGGSVSHTVVRPEESCVPSAASESVAKWPASSSSSKMVPTVVQGAVPSAGKLGTTSEGESKAAGQRPYKILYQPLKTLPSSTPALMGMSSVFTTTAPLGQSTVRPTQHILLPANIGVTTQRFVVPVSHTASTKLLTCSTLPSSVVTSKTSSRLSALQSTGPVQKMAPPTVIFVSPPASGTLTAATPSVVCAPGSISSVRSKPPQLPSAGVISSVRPQMSPTLSMLTQGPATAAVSQGASTTEPVVSQWSAQPVVSFAASHAAPWSGHSASMSGSDATHMVSTTASVTGHSVSTSGSLMAHSVSQALFQLAHTVKADLLGHTPNTVKAEPPAPAVTNASMAGPSGGINTQVSSAFPSRASITTYRIAGVPGLSQDSGTSSGPVGVISIPEQTPTLLKLEAPTPESVYAFASQGPPANGPTHAPMPPAASTVEGGGGGGGSQLGEGEAVTWDKVCTLKLIQLYKEHQIYLSDPHYKKKSVWELIASKLRLSVPNGPPFRWNHVENKWKNMTKKFRDCVNLNRQGSMVTRCNFFDEIAAIYNYSADEDKKKAAEGLQELKTGMRRHAILPQVQNSSFIPASGGDLSISANAVSIQMQNGSIQTDSCSSAGSSVRIIDDVPLVKKKKYAHLDVPSPSYPKRVIPHSFLFPRSHPPPPPPPPPGADVRQTGGMDVEGLLQQLREDRARQERVRMERLEKMHQEKMALFKGFLDVLQQVKQSKE